ncbi:MAG: hypothetical protein HRT61_09460 [Ekhidna sp.]|nr:hypothetical protein [Ekhidna sp.]
MKLVFSIFICFLLEIGLAKAQLSEVPLETWRTFEIDSKFLEEKRRIQVYLPNGYVDSAKGYPVLYILDGQRLFEHAVSVAKSFEQFRLTPPFIIVGISNKYPDRFSNFSSRSTLFMKFIEEEVIKNTDTKFQTTGEKLLFGWEYGGSFALEMLSNKPELFDGYILASSYPVKNKLDLLDSLLNAGLDEPINLFFSSAQGEGIVNEEALLLKDILEKTPVKDFEWQYLQLANEEHRSTPYSTLYHGIKNFYHYFPVIQFATVDEFREFGGVESVKDYYLKRSALFGFPPEVPNWTRFSIVRNAIRDDNLVEFKRLYDIYIDQDLILGLRNNQPYTLTDYFVKNDMHQAAIEVYQVLLTKRPESKILLSKLVESHKIIGNSKESKKFSRLAEKAEEE